MAEFKSSSFIHMSLEDIIKIRKRENARAKRNKVKAQPFKPPAKAPITYARKNIEKIRLQVVREKQAQLAKQRNARFRLEKFREERASGPSPGQVRNTFPNRGISVWATPINQSDKPEPKPNQTDRIVGYSPQMFNGSANRQLKITIYNKELIAERERDLKLWQTLLTRELINRAQQKLADDLDALLKKCRLMAEKKTS